MQCITCQVYNHKISLQSTKLIAHAEAMSVFGVRMKREFIMFYVPILS